MKKLLGIGLALVCGITLAACGTTKETSSSSSKETQKSATAESTDSSTFSNGKFVYFTSGVESGQKVYADETGYITITGKVSYGDMVSLYDTVSGVLMGSAEVEAGEFSLSCNMTGADPTTLVLTNDDLYMELKVDTDTLINTEELTFVPNDDSSSSSSEAAPSSTNFAIGESGSFSTDAGDKMTITINAVTVWTSDDDFYTPTGKYFAKVDFTVKNDGTSPLEEDSGMLDYYDSSDVQSEMISKDFWSSTIQPGKAANGTAYFDVPSDGKDFEIFVGDASWKGTIQ